MYTFLNKCVYISIYNKIALLLHNKIFMILESAAFIILYLHNVIMFEDSIKIMVNKYRQSIKTLHADLNHVSQFSDIRIIRYKSCFLHHRIFLAI